MPELHRVAPKYDPFPKEKLDRFIEIIQQYYPTLDEAGIRECFGRTGTLYQYEIPRADWPEFIEAASAINAEFEKLDPSISASVFQKPGEEPSSCCIMYQNFGEIID